MRLKRRRVTRVPAGLGGREWVKVWGENHSAYRRGREDTTAAIARDELHG